MRMFLDRYFEEELQRNGYHVTLEELQKMYIKSQRRKEEIEKIKNDRKKDRREKMNKNASILRF